MYLVMCTYSIVYHRRTAPALVLLQPTSRLATASPPRAMRRGSSRQHATSAGRLLRAAAPRVALLVVAFQILAAVEAANTWIANDGMNGYDAVLYGASPSSNACAFTSAR